jgi:(2Fe-2S) ferredoxin
MVVYPGPVFYQEVDRQRIVRIAAEHFVSDRPVADYFWVDASGYKPVRPGKVAITWEPLPRKPLPRKSEQPRPETRKKSYDVDDFKW